MALANGGLQGMAPSERSMSSNSLNGGAVETLRCRMAGLAWYGRVMCGEARSGMFGCVLAGVVMYGLVCYGKFRSVGARRGELRRDKVWQVRCGTLWFGIIWWVMACQGELRPGKARQARHGAARSVKARYGLVWLGRRGLAG